MSEFVTVSEGEKDETCLVHTSREDTRNGNFYVWLEFQKSISARLKFKTQTVEELMTKPSEWV